MVLSRCRRGPALIVAAALLLAPVVAAEAKPSDRRRARMAVGYIASQQEANGSIVAFSPIGDTADAIASMVAARRGKGTIGPALGFLRRKTRRDRLDTVGLKAKVVAAVVAAGRDPRDFGGHNLVRELKKSEDENGLYGGGQVFDQTLVLLALKAANAKISDAAIAWLVNAQCRDGGWQFDVPPGNDDDKHCFGGGADFTQSDTNTTAMAVQALHRLGADTTKNPFWFFRRIRDEQYGGWGYSWGFETTDANSTALVLEAYDAKRKDPLRGSRGALKDLQYRLCGQRNGAFAYTWTPDGKRDGPNLGATIPAVVALLRKHLPIKPHEVTKPATGCGGSP